MGGKFPTRGVEMRSKFDTVMNKELSTGIDGRDRQERLREQGQALRDLRFSTLPRSLHSNSVLSEEVFERSTTRRRSLSVRLSSASHAEVFADTYLIVEAVHISKRPALA